EFVYEVNFPEKTNGEHEFVEQLWARRKVGYLLDQIRANGEKKELVEEVVILAKKYGIATPYTSYLVVPDGPTPVVTKPRPHVNPLRPRGGPMPEALAPPPGAKAPQKVVEFLNKQGDAKADAGRAKFEKDKVASAPTSAGADDFEGQRLLQTREQLKTLDE